MKNTIYTLIITLAFLSCKAQTPIISLFDGNFVPRIQNAYYKDIDDDFSRFVGTWKYTNDSQEFKIILNKKSLDIVQRTNGKTYYTDYIYGEYEYKDGTGNTLVNTLTNINNTAIDVSEHLIFGNRMIPYKNLPPCEGCTANERRIVLSITDPARAYLNTNIVLRTVPNPTLPNVNDLELTMTLSHSTFPEGAPTLPRILEYRTYYRLIKQ